jgi:hypothetical protein
MRLANATALRIGGQDAIEARLGGAVVWSGATQAFDLNSLFPGGRLGVKLEIIPDNLFKDTAGTVPVTTDGDLVARINDTSGNGFNAVNGTESQQATYRTDGTLHWLEWTPGKSYDLASAGAMFSGASYGATFAVTEPANVSNADRRKLVSFSAGSLDNRTRHDTIVTGNRIGIAGRRVGSDSYVVWDYTSDPIIKQVTAHIQDWQNARGILRKNGAQVLDEPMHDAGVSSSDTSSFVVLGGHIKPADKPLEYFEGKAFGLLVLSNRLDADVPGLEQYLGDLAGITL